VVPWTDSAAEISPSDTVLAKTICNHTLQLSVPKLLHGQSKPVPFSVANEESTHKKFNESLFQK
jgi:hypothetical protein